jgi:interleukin-like EMT inducer protein
MQHPGSTPYAVLLVIVTLGWVLLPIQPPMAAAPGRRAYGRATTATPAAPSLTITYPNGGEPHVAGTDDVVLWNSTEVSGSVKIEYSLNGGASWFPIYHSTEDDGVAPWTVQGPPTTQARVRVTSLSNPAVSDTSNANFTIHPPTIRVMYPNGGEPHVAGTNDVILWSGAGISGNVKIEYSRNGGATWIPIYPSTVNDGSAVWTVQSPATTQALVRVTSLNKPAISDVSNANFTIQASPPTVYKAISRGAHTARWPFDYGGVTIERDGLTLYYAEGGGPGRGWTVVAVNLATGELVIPIKTYDTWNNYETHPQLTAAIRALPPGTLLLLAVGDEAGLTFFDGCEPLTDPRVREFVDLLESLGAMKVDQYCYRASYALAVVIGGRVLDESYADGLEVSVTAALPL